MEYHVPVLCTESVDWLIHDANGIYVDVTFGGGGYTREILSKIDKGHVYAFDQDNDAAEKAGAITDNVIAPACSAASLS